MMDDFKPETHNQSPLYSAWQKSTSMGRNRSGILSFAIGVDPNGGNGDNCRTPRADFPFCLF
jgi:hypothetical protein